MDQRAHLRPGRDSDFTVSIDGTQYPDGVVVREISVHFVDGVIEDPLTPEQALCSARRSSRLPKRPTR
jgi:hypothetical protein